MDLLVIDDNRDFIAVKKGGCMNCAETKLNCKILKIFSIEPKEFIELKNLGLQGIIIKCVCNDFRNMELKSNKNEKDKKKDYLEKQKDDKEKEKIDLEKKKREQYLISKQQEEIQMNYAMDHSRKVK